MTTVGTARGAAGVGLDDPTLAVRSGLHEAFRRRRRERRVQRCRRADGHPYWVVVRHADATRILKDDDTFSSRHGVNLQQIRPAAPDPAADLLLEMCGPQRHPELRPRLAAAYTRSAMAPLQERLRAAAADVLDAAVAAGRFDAARDLAAPLAALTAFELLGVPRADWSLLAAGNHRAESMDPALPVRPPFGTATEEATHDLLRYFLRLITDRRDELSPGVVTTMLDGQVDGGPWSRHAIVLNALGLMDAGYGTLRHATTGGVLALLENPEQHERVRAEPELLPALCEEVARWVSPVLHLARVATRDVALAGAEIEAGDIVTVWLVSANRDEDVFDAPDRFDAARRPNRHLAYSTGRHSCLAGGLARLHLEIVLGEFVRRVAPGGRAGPVRRVVSNIVNGIDRLPVTVRAAR